MNHASDRDLAAARIELENATTQWRNAETYASEMATAATDAGIVFQRFGTTLKALPLRTANGVPDPTVEELQRQLDAVKRERDTLLACRSGEQGCFECPDGNCGDNQNPSVRAAVEVGARLAAEDRLAYAVADVSVAQFNGTHQAAVEELVRYIRLTIDGDEPGCVRTWMRFYEQRKDAGQ